MKLKAIATLFLLTSFAFADGDPFLYLLQRLTQLLLLYEASIPVD